jgi:ribonuclease T1
MKLVRNIVVVLAIIALWWWTNGDRPETAIPSEPASQVGHDAKPSGDSSAASPASNARKLPDFLPREAHQTIELILKGGPFPHRQDGTVFGNRERLLPQQPRGYYREYTVRTPGGQGRGARRIVAGGEPPREFWYTADHYRSFRRFEVER